VCHRRGIASGATPFDAVATWSYFFLLFRPFRIDFTILLNFLDNFFTTFWKRLFLFFDNTVNYADGLGHDYICVLDVQFGCAFHRRMRFRRHF
jgi:hypothetical protein